MELVGEDLGPCASLAMFDLSGRDESQGIFNFFFFSESGITIKYLMVWRAGLRYSRLLEMQEVASGGNK